MGAPVLTVIIKWELQASLDWVLLYLQRPWIPNKERAAISLNPQEGNILCDSHFTLDFHLLNNAPLSQALNNSWTTQSFKLINI